MSTLFPSVDTSFSGFDTSRLLPSVETHCLQVLTLIESGFDTQSSTFKDFGYWPQVSTLPVLGDDTYHFSSRSLATDRRCWHFLDWVSTLVFPNLNICSLSSRVDTFCIRCQHFIFPDSYLWLLTLGVDTFVAGVDTSRLELVSLFSWSFEHRLLHDLRDVFPMDVYPLHYVQSSEIHYFLLLFKTLNGFDQYNFQILRYQHLLNKCQYFLGKKYFCSFLLIIEL